MPLWQKLKDDKFVILDGSIESLNVCSDTTNFLLIRHDDKAYEAFWYNSDDTLLHVAFPIQYELILGMPQIEIEQHLQEYISTAIRHQETNMSEVALDSIAPHVYCSAPLQQYQLPSLNNSRYYYKYSEDSISLICDSAFVDYTIANLFQDGLGKDYVMQVSQSVYGFKRLDYSIRLSQWINYCKQEHITSYVAVEETYQDGWMVLIVAENRDLAYNHILSVLVPKTIFLKQDVTLNVKISAFIPTHNVKDLYQQYQQTKKHTYE